MPNERLRTSPVVLLRDADADAQRGADEGIEFNTHIYRFPASQAPVLHLRRVTGGDMVTTYLDSYERVWDTASPVEWG